MRILITGGTSGIAYSSAKKLARKGNKVFLCTHTEEQKNSLKKKLIEERVHNILVFKLDITNEEDLKLLDKLYYDVLWAHAGIGCGGTLLAMSVDILRENYNTNVFGTMEVVRRAYLNFLNRNISGKIFVTSSLAGSLPLPYLSCYTSSKAALSILISTMQKELFDSRSKTRLSLIEPGAYKTGFNEVMIDNKEKFLDKDNFFYNNINNINRVQKTFFNLIEKDNYRNLVRKIVKEILSDNPDLIIRSPFFQVAFLKIYSLVFM